MAADQIPFVTIKSDPVFSGFVGLAESENVKSVQCLNPANDLGLPEGEDAFPLNCVLGIFHPNSLNDSSNDSVNQNTDASNIKYFCTACKPGFKPTLSDLDLKPPMVVECISENCGIIGDSVNICQSCAEGFAFGLSANGNINYQHCEEFSADSNCLAINDSSECVYCKKSYSLNFENTCEKIEIPFCKADQSEILSSFDISLLPSYLKLLPKGIGCH